MSALCIVFSARNVWYTKYCEWPRDQSNGGSVRFSKRTWQ